MTVNPSKRRSERLRRRKNTVFQKAHELGKLCGVDVAVIVFQHGRCFMYKSIEQEAWPPSIEEIVSKVDVFINAPLIHLNYSKTLIVLKSYHHTTLNNG